MDSEIRVRITEFLFQQGTSIDMQTPKQLDHLEKITSVIIRRENALKSARNKIAANKLTIASIAKEAGIARKTIYNNPLLREMIVDAAKRSGTSDPDRLNIHKLKDQIHTLENQVHLLVIHDIDMQELQHHNEELRRDYIEKEIRINNLEKEYMKALAEIKKLRKNLFESK